MTVNGTHLASDSIIFVLDFGTFLIIYIYKFNNWEDKKNMNYVLVDRSRKMKFLLYLQVTHVRNYISTQDIQ